MCQITLRAKRERHFKTLQLTSGGRSTCPAPGGVSQDRQVKCQGRKVITIIRWRDYVKAPTRTYGPPSRSAGEGSQQSEEDRATATRSLSLDATGAAV